MDKYTREIMGLLKNVFENVAGAHAYQTESEARTYYLENLNDNLYKPMNETAEKAYGKGSGNEIASGKMNALRSSSALTYNLFWNQTAKFKEGSERIGSGEYFVEFEKQYHTLNSSAKGLPANLDAFLYCKDTCEAVACEMKMMEWIFNKPSALRRKYLDPKNYVNEAVGEVFVRIAKSLIPKEALAEEQDEYSGSMTRYDAFQMFKHTVACYSACAGEEAREIKKLTLVNCAWTLSIPEVLEPKHCKRYRAEEKLEHCEFEEFKKLMQPAIKLFSDIGVDFDICFYSFNDFLKLMEKNEDELDYLRRYTVR